LSTNCQQFRLTEECPDLNLGRAGRCRGLNGEVEVKKMMETVAAPHSLALPVGELNVRRLKDGSQQRLRGQLPLSLLSPLAPSISPRFPCSPVSRFIYLT